MSRPSAMAWVGLAGALALSWSGVAEASASKFAAPAKPQASVVPEVSAEAEARVILRCKVTSERTLEACAVASETPAGHGLGEAALKMAKDVRINADTFRPEMVGRTLEIPIRFAQDAPTEDEMGVASTPM